MFSVFWDEYGLSIVALSIIIFIGIMWLVHRRYTSQASKNQPVLPKFSQHSVNMSSNVSKGEAECKRVLEEYFNKTFDKARPDFLRNPVTSGTKNNFNLELDCYNPDLKIAVEYNGKQHYTYTPFFHRNKEAFLNQKYRDELKRMLCRENGVTLIEVPYTISVDKIRDFLYGMLKSLKIPNNNIVV